MIRMKTAKTLGLIFGILCIVALGGILCCAVTLPSRSTFVTFYGTVTRVSPGYFDLDYLSSVILLLMGAFLGFSVFGSIQIEKKTKEPKEAVTEEISSSDAAETSAEEVKAEE